MSVVVGIDAAYHVAFANVTGETLGITDSLPGFETHKRASLLVRSPYSIGIGIVAVDTQHRASMFVAEGNLGNLLPLPTVFNHQSVFIVRNR